MPPVLEIGTRREPFVDDWLIEEMRGARLELHKPERREVAFCLDASWEDCVAFPERVLAWEGSWRLTTELASWTGTARRRRPSTRWRRVGTGSRSLAPN